MTVCDGDDLGSAEDGSHSTRGIKEEVTDKDMGRFGALDRGPVQSSSGKLKNLETLYKSSDEDWNHSKVKTPPSSFPLYFVMLQSLLVGSIHI